jgi:hypothetical protein
MGAVVRNCPDVRENRKDGILGNTRTAGAVAAAFLPAYLFFVAWSVARGSRSVRELAGGMLHAAALLALDLLLPVAASSRASFGWRLAAATARRTDPSGRLTGDERSVALSQRL